MNLLRRNNSNEITNKYKWLVLTTTLIGSFMVVLNGSLMNVALPYFADLFDVDLVRGQWIITAFVLSMTISMSLTNYLAKRIGNKNVYLIGIVIFLLSSIGGSFSWNFESIIIFRFLQGIGGGLITPISMVIVYEYFNINERGTAMGIWGVVVMIAPTIGPVIGGGLLEFSHWSYLFTLNVPLCLVSIIFTLAFIKEEHKVDKLNFDWMGFILIIISLLTFLIGIDLFQTKPDVINSFLLTIGLITGIWFVINQKQKKNPLIEINILSNKGFSSSLIILAFNTVAMYSVLILIPIIYQQILKESVFLSGIILVPHALLMGISMTLGGKLLDKHGPYKVVLSGTIIMSFASFLLFLLDDYNSLLLILIIISIHGFGCGFMSTPTTTAGLNSLKSHQIPSGSSLNNLFRQLIKIYAVFSITYLYNLNSTIKITEEELIKYIFLAISILLLISTYFIFINKIQWNSKQS